MKANHFARFHVTLALAVAAILSGCQKQSESPSAPPAPAKPALVSAEKTSFDEVTSKLNPGGNLYLYLSTEQALSGLSEKMGSLSNFAGSMPNMPADNQQNIGKVITFVENFIKDSGVEQISGLGMSSIAREPGLYFTKSVLHHYRGQDSGLIWSAFGRSGHPLPELDLLPDTTAMAFFSDLDVPLVWTNVQQEINQLDMPQVSASLAQWPAQFHKMTGLDFDAVLASLGGNYGIIFTLDKEKKISVPVGGQVLEIPSPAVVIVARVKSDIIFDRVDQTMKNNPLVVRVEKPDLRMRTMNIPLPLPLDLHPSIARSGDYLLLGTSDAVVQEIVAVKSGQKKGFKASDEFKRLSQGMPESANNFSILTPAFGQLMTQIQGQILSQNKSMSPGQGAALRKMFAGNTNATAYSVGVNGPEGWEGFANGNQNIQALIVPAIVGSAGMLAAIAIPNFVKARGTAQYNTIINNLRLLDAAKQQWTLEKQREIGNPVSMDDLKPYLPPNGLKSVAGEEYIPHAIGTPPTARLTQGINGHAAGSEISITPEPQ
jgi:hypothetical protein